MRNKRARKIKAGILETYGELTAQQKEIAVKTKKFKAIYRAAKNNYHLNKNRQTPIYKLSKRQQRLSKAIT